MPRCFLAKKSAAGGRTWDSTLGGKFHNIGTASFMLGFENSKLVYFDPFQVDSPYLRAVEMKKTPSEIQVFKMDSFVWLYCICRSKRIKFMRILFVNIVPRSTY